MYRLDVNVDAVVALYINYLVEIHNYDLCKTMDMSFDDLFGILFENHIRAISTNEGVAYFECRKREISVNLDKNIN